MKSRGSLVRTKVALSALVLVTLVNFAMLLLLATDDLYTSRFGAPLHFGRVLDASASLAFGLLGGLLTVRRPGNLVGWAMLLAASSMVGDLLDSYARLALFSDVGSGLTGGALAAVLSYGSWTPLMAGVFLLLLLFPTGQVPARRWGVVARIVLAGFALIWLAIAIDPRGGEPPYEDLVNPIAIEGHEEFLVAIFPVIFFCLACIAAAFVDLGVRFWRSRGEEREQYKWLAYTSGLLVAALPLNGTGGFGIDWLSTLAGPVFALGLIGLPLSVAVAVLKYRLYAIDRIINRTLVYGLLTGILAAAYFGLVVGLQAVFKPVTGNSDLAIALTTLIVAGLFLPARQRVQALVDRRFNRRAYDVAKTLDAFGARLRQNVDLDTLRYELLTVVDETMEPSKVSIWLRPPTTKV